MAKVDRVRRGSGGVRAATNNKPREVPPPARGLSVRLAAAGITNSLEFGAWASALIGDVMQGKVTPQVCSAACNAAGKLLKVHEMAQRYGTAIEGEKRKLLALT